MNIFMNFYKKIKNSKTIQWHFTDRQIRYILLGISVLTVFLLFCFFRHLAPFVYQTNDDLFLRMIASGEMSGVPESHLHFIFYPAGLFFSLLYSLFPSLPWYGLFLCCSFGLTMILVLHSLLKQEKTLLIQAATIFLFCIVSYSFFFPHITSLQFTTSAGIAAAGALFLFAVSSPSDSFRETLKNYAGFFLLSTYAFCIRNQVLLMCIPFFGMIGLSKYLDAGNLSDAPLSDKQINLSLFCKNRQQKNLLLLGSIFLVMLASFFLIEKFAYYDNNWRTFRSYSTVRASVYDYEGYPDYDAYEKTYQELGLTRSSYDAAAHRYSLLLEPAINQHTMEVLEAISKEEQAASSQNIPEKLRKMLSFFLERHLSDADKPLNLLVYRCYLLFLICAVFSRKWKALRDILFTLFARMAIWTYLIFYGRLPIRISQTIYLAELALLFAIAFGYKLWQNRLAAKRKLCYAIWIMSIFFIFYTCIRSGIPNAKAVAKESAARLQFSESFVDIKQYFNTRPDDFFYLDTNSFAYFTEDALQTAPQESSNYLFMGGWAAKSPWYEKKLKANGILEPATALYENPNVYAVFMNSETTDYAYLEAFYAENYPNVQIEVVDTIETANGLSFSILKGIQEKTP